MSDRCPVRLVKSHGSRAERHGSQPSPRVRSPFAGHTGLTPASIPVPAPLVAPAGGTWRYQPSQSILDSYRLGVDKLVAQLRAAHEC